MILPTARVLFAFNSPEIRHEFASTLLHLLKKINMTDSKSQMRIRLAKKEVMSPKLII